MYCSTHIGTYSSDVTPIGSLGSLGSLCDTSTKDVSQSEVARGSMAIGGAVSVAAVRLLDSCTTTYVVIGIPTTAVLQLGLVLNLENYHSKH